MNTMHELLMPEMNEPAIVERQAQAETQALAARATESGRQGATGTLQPKLHFPRLRRNSTAGAA